MLQTLLITTVAWLALSIGTAMAAGAQDSVAPDSPEPPIASAVGLTLQAAIDRSLANNQELTELRLQAESLGFIPSQAGALPDPTLGLNALNLPTDTFDIDQEPMTQMQISLSQSIPFPGKRGLKREAAEYEASAATNKVLAR